MLNRLLVAVCVFAMSVTSFAQEAAKTEPKKKVKKTVVTTTTETDENGKTTTKTEKSESDESPAPVAPVVAAPSDEGLPTINESWYFSVGAGLSGASYSGSVGDSYDTLSDKTDSDDGLSINLDLFGFYWPLSNNTMLGVVYHATASSVTNDTTDEELTISTALLGASLQHFFGKNIGHGFFLRGDVGYSTAGVDYDDGILGTADYDETSDGTLGILIGGGYGFRIGQGTRLLVGLNIRPLPKYKFDNLNGSSGELKGTVINTSATFLF